MIAMQIREFSLQLTKSFVSNKGHQDRIRHLMVTLEIDGVSGIGVCRLDRDLSMHAVDVLHGHIEQAALEDPMNFATALEALMPRSALTVACELALFDLFGKRLGKPVKYLFGRNEPDIRTPVTVGAGTVTETLAAVTNYRDWPMLKLKLRKADSLAVILEEVRAIYSGEIWVDANGAFDLETIKPALLELARSGVAVLEQPFPKGRLDWLSGLKDRQVKIAIDEDIVGASSISGISGKADIVNIKLQTTGGLSKAFETIREARRTGLQTMIGCRSESVAGVTAAAVLAHATDHVDLDGHLDIEDDPFSGMLVVKGSVWRPNSPGIGIFPRTEFFPETTNATNEMCNSR